MSWPARPHRSDRALARLQHLARRRFRHGRARRRQLAGSTSVPIDARVARSAEAAPDGGIVGAAHARRPSCSSSSRARRTLAGVRAQVWPAPAFCLPAPTAPHVADRRKSQNRVVRGRPRAEMGPPPGAARAPCGRHSRTAREERRRPRRTQAACPASTDSRSAAPSPSRPAVAGRRLKSCAVEHWPPGRVAFDVARARAACADQPASTRPLLAARAPRARACAGRRRRLNPAAEDHRRARARS